MAAAPPSPPPLPSPQDETRQGAPHLRSVRETDRGKGDSSQIHPWPRWPSGWLAGSRTGREDDDLDADGREDDDLARRPDCSVASPHRQVVIPRTHSLLIWPLVCPRFILRPRLPAAHSVLPTSF